MACAMVSQLKRISPATSYSLITAGSPMGKNQNYLRWTQKCYFSASSAYRTWPVISQPDPAIVKKYIGYYSDADRTVIPVFARSGHAGELIELHGLSHRDLYSPDKMGPLLTKSDTPAKGGGLMSGVAPRAIGRLPWLEVVRC